MLNSVLCERDRLTIIVTNDDGVQAEGLWALATELSKIAEVVIVAPDRDQSGTGASVTMRHPLRMTRIHSSPEVIAAYSVEGTPADSVILAINSVLKNRKVDLVVSGINEGPNLGDDVFISGTVGAALQGYFYGIPSIALSIAAFGALRFEAAARLARILASAIMRSSFNCRLLLNINIPNLPLYALKGIEITKLGERKYVDRIEPGYDGKREYHWIMRGESKWHIIPGTDIWALEQDKISITPFPTDIDKVNQEFLQKLISQVFNALQSESV